MPQTFTQSLIDLIQPMLYLGAEDLQIYLGGLGSIFEQIDSWVSDTDPDPEPNGVRKPGYSLWVDVDRVPDEAIPWLGQFVGVSVVSGMNPTDQKDQLRGLGTWHRGTLTALRAAAMPYLIGSKTLIIKERDTSAYHFEVITYGSETPDSSVVLAALLTQKPAGLVMTYVVDSGQKAFTMRDSGMRGTPQDTLRLVI